MHFFPFSFDASVAFQKTKGPDNGIQTKAQIRKQSKKGNKKKRVYRKTRWKIIYVHRVSTPAPNEWLQGIHDSPKC